MTVQAHLQSMLLISLLLSGLPSVSALPAGSSESSGFSTGVSRLGYSSDATCAYDTLYGGQSSQTCLVTTATDRCNVYFDRAGKPPYYAVKAQYVDSNPTGMAVFKCTEGPAEPLSVAITMFCGLDPDIVSQKSVLLLSGGEAFCYATSHFASVTVPGAAIQNNLNDPIVPTSGCVTGPKYQLTTSDVLVTTWVTVADLLSYLPGTNLNLGLTISDSGYSVVNDAFQISARAQAGQFADEWAACVDNDSTADIRIWIAFTPVPSNWQDVDITGTSIPSRSSELSNASGVSEKYLTNRLEQYMVHLQSTASGQCNNAGLSTLGSSSGTYRAINIVYPEHLLFGKVDYQCVNDVSGLTSDLPGLTLTCEFASLGRDDFMQGVLLVYQDAYCYQTVYAKAEPAEIPDPTGSLGPPPPTCVDGPDHLLNEATQLITAWTYYTDTAVDELGNTILVQKYLTGTNIYLTHSTTGLVSETIDTTNGFQVSAKGQIGESGSSWQACFDLQRNDLSTVVIVIALTPVPDDFTDESSFDPYAVS